MKVAIDLRSLKPGYKGGLRGFTKGLLSGFSSDVDVHLITYDYAASSVREEFPGYVVDVVKFSVFRAFLYRICVVLAYFSRSIGLLKLLSNLVYLAERRKLNDASYDIVICPTTYLLNAGIHARTITCLHDIQEEYFPENFTYLQRVWRYVMARFTLKYSDVTQVSSDFVK